MEQARGWAGCSEGSGDSGCSRAFVAAMSGLRVPLGSQPTLAALQDDSPAPDPRLVDCLLFLKNSEEVPHPPRLPQFLHWRHQTRPYYVDVFIQRWFTSE